MKLGHEVLEENTRYRIIKLPNGFNIYHKGTKRHPELECKWLGLIADRNVAINIINYMESMDASYDKAIEQLISTHGK